MTVEKLTYKNPHLLSRQVRVLHCRVRSQVAQDSARQRSRPHRHLYIAAQERLTQTMRNALAQSITSFERPWPSGLPPHLVSYLMWGCIIFGILGVLAMIGGIHKLYSARDTEDTVAAFKTVGGGSVIAAACAVVHVAVLVPISHEQAEGLVPTETSAVPVVAATSGDSTDWTSIGWLGPALVALALTVYAAASIHSHFAHRRALDRSIRIDYATADALYSEVADAFAAHLADPDASITRPLLDNLGEPRTAAFIDAFAAVNQLRSEQYPSTRAQVLDLVRAAREAHTAWRTADEHARSNGTSMDSADDSGSVSVLPGTMTNQRHSNESRIRGTRCSSLSD